MLLDRIPRTGTMGRILGGGHMQASPKRSLSSVLCYISHEVARGLSRSQGSDDVPLLAWIASGDRRGSAVWVGFFLPSNWVLPCLLHALGCCRFLSVSLTLSLSLSPSLSQSLSSHPRRVFLASRSFAGRSLPKLRSPGRSAVGFVHENSLISEARANDAPS